MKEKSYLAVASALMIGLAVLTVYYGFMRSDQSLLSAQWEKRKARLESLDTRLRALADQIQAVQGESRCERDDQCRIRGIGAKVCGLYKDFIVYSLKDANEPKLLSLLSDFNRLHEKVVDLNLSANQCGENPSPIQCIAGTCEPKAR